MTQLSEAIETQPAVLRNVLELELELAVETLERAATISIVGTGSSQHAAELGARLLAEGGRDVSWASSASFVRGATDLSSSDAVVVISHTGETAFAQAARQRALDADAGLVTLTGVGAGWPEAIELAPRELSETYTASYTAVLLALARFARSLDGRLAEEEIESLPARVEGALGDRSLDELRPPGRLLTMIGSGFAAITAREGALKAREAAGLVSEGFEAEYFLHGQAVPLGSEDALVAGRAFVRSRRPRRCSRRCRVARLARPWRASTSLSACTLSSCRFRSPFVSSSSPPGSPTSGVRTRIA